MTALAIFCATALAADPTVLFEKEIGRDNGRVLAAGKYVFQTDKFAKEVRVWDITDAAAPAVLGKRDTANWPDALLLDGDTLYVSSRARGDSVIEIFNVANPLDVTLTATIPITTCIDSVYSMVINKGKLVVAADECGVLTIDMKAPYAAEQYAYADSMRTSHVSVLGDYYFISDWSSGFYIVDFSKADPSIVTHLNSRSFAVNVLTSDRVYVTGSGVVLAYENKPPFSILGKASVSTPSSAALGPDPDRLWVSNDEGDISIINFSNVKLPAVEGTTSTGYEGGQVSSSGNFAFYSGEGAFVVLSAPPAPTPMPTPMPTPEPTPEPTPQPPPTPQPTVAHYDIGCFDTSGGRFLTNLIYTGGENTPAYCATLCGGKGHTFAGVEYGKECWCGDAADKMTYPKGAVKTAGSQCDMMCTGDKTQTCGAGHRVRLYSLTAALSEPAPAAVGCFETSLVGGVRELTHAYTDDSALTVGECTSVCRWNGYKYAGLEYGKQCWCGNSLPSVRTIGTQCSRPCSGDASQICGAGYRASVYQLEGTPEVFATTYLGCYADSSTRSLSHLAFHDSGCTVDECVAVCGHNGYSLAGLQYRKQCWCGNSISSAKLAESDCRMACDGDSSQICGYAWRHSLYSINP